MGACNAYLSSFDCVPGLMYTYMCQIGLIYVFIIHIHNVEIVGLLKTMRETIQQG